MNNGLCWVSTLAYPNLLGIKTFVDVVDVDVGLKNAIHQQKFLVTTPLEGTMI